MKTEQNRMNGRNQGFSLITVMIAVAFVGILGMLVIYISAANLDMKITDLKGKDSFYTAEQALEEIRTGLQEDVGDAMSKAYIQVLENYNSNGSSASDVSLDDLRQSKFKDAFVKEITKRLGKAGNSTQYNVDYLKKYIDLKDSAKFDQNSETLIVTTPDGEEPLMKKDVSSGIVLKNLKVIYVDPKGRASVIRTDIRLGIPKIQFPTASTLPDLMNMAIVADSGIICEANKQQPVKIRGNVYAGRLKNDLTLLQDYPRASVMLKDYGGMVVESGERFVSGGDIILKKESSLTTSSMVNLWAQGISLSSSDVKLLGTTYLADDLTVEKGSGSYVQIYGDYYGYGSPSTARNSKNSTLYANEKDADLSSAIVINGKNTTLDLTEIGQLMLSGRTYVSTSSVSAISDMSNSADVLTGESITVKGTQVAYLAPPSVFVKQEGDKDTVFTNPMTFETYRTYLEKNGYHGIQVDLDAKVKAWGEKTLRKIGVNEEKPLQEVFYNDNSSTGYVYFYLNFKTEKAASDFMALYYQDQTAIKKAMDKNLSFYFGGEGSGILVRNKNTYLRYITNGNVLSYKGGSKAEGDLVNATSPSSVSELEREQLSYQNTWYALNRKMISSPNLLNKKVKDLNGDFDHTEDNPTRSVFDNLINENALHGFLFAQSGQKYEFLLSSSSSMKAVLYENTSEYEISSAEAQDLRLVICTGDVRIKEGTHFKGIILTKGKLTVESNVILEAASVEAAKVFMAKLPGETEISPRDFFWDGSKYVLGTSVSDQDQTQSENRKEDDIYELAEWVTYENWKKQ